MTQPSCLFKTNKRQKVPFTSRNVPMQESYDGYVNQSGSTKKVTTTSSFFHKPMMSVIGGTNKLSIYQTIKAQQIFNKKLQSRQIQNRVGAVKTINGVEGHNLKSLRTSRLSYNIQPASGSRERRTVRKVQLVRMKTHAVLQQRSEGAPKLDGCSNYNQHNQRNEKDKQSANILIKEKSLVSLTTDMKNNLAEYNNESPGEKDQRFLKGVDMIINVNSQIEHDLKNEQRGLLDASDAIRTLKLSNNNFSSWHNSSRKNSRFDSLLLTQRSTRRPEYRLSRILDSKAATLTRGSAGAGLPKSLAMTPRQNNQIQLRTREKLSTTLPDTKQSRPSEKRRIALVETEKILDEEQYNNVHLPTVNKDRVAQAIAEKDSPDESTVNSLMKVAQTLKLDDVSTETLLRSRCGTGTASVPEKSSYPSTKNQSRLL